MHGFVQNTTQSWWYVVIIIRNKTYVSYFAFVWKMWYLNVGFPRKSICRRSFRFICHYLPLSVFGLHYVVLYPWNSIKIRHTYVFKCPYLSIVVIYITQVRFIWTLNSILYIITTCVCVRPTGQFRVLMDQRNRPGRSDSENGNRPEQSDSENGNPGPDDWCATSFVKTKRRKSRGEFPLRGERGGRAGVGGGEGGVGQQGWGERVLPLFLGGFFFLGPPSFSWGWLEWRSHGLSTLGLSNKCVRPQLSIVRWRQY